MPFGFGSKDEAPKPQQEQAEVEPVAPVASTKTLSLTEEQLARIVSAAVSAARAPNAKEARELEADIERERRRSLMQIEFGRAEEAKIQRKKFGCTHTRDKNSGNSVAKGTDTWTTSGQAHSPDLATLICTRCSYIWQWKPTAHEYEYIQQQGMMGFAPPPENRIVNEG